MTTVKEAFLTDDDYDPLLDKYVNCMAEVKRRTLLVYDYLLKKRSTGYMYTNTEFLCLQFRKVLELIALSSLVSNQDIYSKQHANFANHYHAKHIFRDIEKLNPNFYPRPINIIESDIAGIAGQFVDLQEGFLTKEEFAEVYDECAGLLHAENPFAAPKDLDKIDSKFIDWFNKICRLTNTHIVQLVDIKRQIIVLMDTKPDGDIQATLLAMNI